MGDLVESKTIEHLGETFTIEVRRWSAIEWLPEVVGLYSLPDAYTTRDEAFLVAETSLKEKTREDIARFSRPLYNPFKRSGGAKGQKGSYKRRKHNFKIVL